MIELFKKPAVKFAELEGDEAAAFRDIALGFREQMPQTSWMSDDQFVGAIAELTETGIARIVVGDRRDGGFDFELVLAGGL